MLLSTQSSTWDVLSSKKGNSMKNRTGILLLASLLLVAALLAFGCSLAPEEDGEPEDQGLTETLKLYSPEAEIVGAFGSSVSIDGDYLIVGAPDEHEGLPGEYQRQYAGSAYIFHRTGNSWDTGTEITAHVPEALDNFGQSVCIKGDYAIVGAYWAETGGAAYIFHRTDTNTWDAGFKILAFDAELDDEFGVSVAIDGDYAIVGAREEDENGEGAGAAYIFHRTDTNTWDTGIKVMGWPVADAWFGDSVAISGDYAVVGAPREVSGGSSAGAVYFYHRVDTNAWEQAEAYDGQTGHVLGRSVAMSGDDALVGAPYRPGGSSDEITSAGAAYAMHRTDAAGWASSAKLLAPEQAEQARFGWSVSTSGDDAIVAAQGQARAFIFHRSGGTSWDSGTEIVASDPSDDDFASCVSISGGTAVVGAPLENGGPGDPLNDCGAVYLYY